MWLPFNLRSPAVNASAGATDPYWSSVVLLTGNDNAANGTTTFTDQSSAAHTVTRSGNPVYSNTTAPTGMTTSIAFDGASAFLTSADSDDWYFDGSFTVEWWVYKTTGSANVTFVSQWTNPANWHLFYESGTMFAQKNNGGGTSYAVSPSSATWYAMAFTWDGTNSRLYQDGVHKVGSTSNIGGTNSAIALFIGARYDGTYSLNGYMGPVRITKGVARYTGTGSYTPPTLPLPTS